MVLYFWEEGGYNLGVKSAILALGIVMVIEIMFFVVVFASLFYISDVVLGTCLYTVTNIYFWVVITWLIRRIRYLEDK